MIYSNKWMLNEGRGIISSKLLVFYHLTLATLMTQILARTTSILEGRYKMQMKPVIYIRTVVPVGLFYGLSLGSSNEVYLHLSAAFIQMPKGAAPIAVLLTLWAFGLEYPTFFKINNLSIIVFGIDLTSLGEIRFEFVGFLLQIFALFFEAFRRAFTQKLLKDDKYKMDPLVNLYYFAPCCAGLICMEGLLKMSVTGEWNVITWEEVKTVGVGLCMSNGHLAVGLNVASVLLMKKQIGKTSSLILTLCGVVKNIILIGTSAYFEGTVITPMQYFGSSVVMVGLVYYNLGGAKEREVAEKARWSELYDDILPNVRRILRVQSHHQWGKNGTLLVA
ncbi:MAG: hypothetical protein Q9204_004313 [Flavoplaca sp. TL-2023a]